MQFLRRISTQRLLALCAAALVVIVGGTAIALAATSGGPVPPKKPLANAVHDAITSPELKGVTARVSFKNNLLSGVDLRGSNPILSGANGRLWATNDGHFRLELQSDGGSGDAQIVSDGKSFWIYDGSSNTVYRGSVPQDRHKHAQEKAPTVSQIQKHIDQVMQHASIKGPTPGNTAGEPSYTVKTSPKKNGGLLGALAFAWDANNGAPLRGAIYAKGSSSPVIEMKATDISFGSVDPSVFNVSPPSGAKSQTLGQNGGGKAGAKHHGKPVTGLANVQKHVNFQVAAPSALAGRHRSDVQSLGKDGAVVTYGKGLNGIAVVQKSGSASSQDNGPLGHTELPTVSINGSSGQELSTPLGTVIRFHRGNVTYLVLGSLPSSAVESAARGL